MLTETMRPCRAAASHALAPHGSGVIAYSSRTHEQCDRQISRCLSVRGMHAFHETSSYVLRNRLVRSRVLHLQCCTLFRDQRANTTSKPKVVGLGSVGLDYLAQVARFPKPDEKLRTEKMEVIGDDINVCIWNVHGAVTSFRTCQDACMHRRVAEAIVPML